MFCGLPGKLIHKKMVTPPEAYNIMLPAQDVETATPRPSTSKNCPHGLNLHMLILAGG